jgi:hypothetical protein
MEGRLYLTPGLVHLHLARDLVHLYLTLGQDLEPRHEAPTAHPAHLLTVLTLLQLMAS